MSWGAVSGHMGVHILLMNVIAPFFVLALRTRLPSPGHAHILPATVAQLVLIWFWHAPPVLGALNGDVHVFMQASLLGSAVYFWWSVLTPLRETWWRSALALLITSKLFCLLGILLTFSPRYLFGGMHGHLGSLGDQQLAGLMMLVACPASYLLAAVWLSARGLMGIDAQPPRQRNA